MMKNSNSKSKTQGIQRRQFIKGAALSAAAFTIVPRHVLGGKGFQAPSDTLNIAGVGIGSMGRSNLSKLTSENIVALCDIDEAYIAKAKIEDKPIREYFSKAKFYRDFRKMLEEQSDIDAVVIATPDHTHAIIASAAMKMGKHVYVQKPLTYTVQEARELAKIAEETGVVTQMGNQGHSSDDARKINEWIWDGAIGDVREVHVWTNRPLWPQGIPAPTEKVAIPDTLDWELFLGPAPYVPYHPAYHPWNWRGWADYGVGALGDMGAHLIDHPNWALKLGYPSTVHGVSSAWLKEPINAKSYPLATIVTYEFPEREGMPPVTMTWYDGGLMPPRPDELAEGATLNPGGGVLMVGDKGKLMHGTYGSNPTLLPQSAMDSYKQPAPTLKRIEVSHEMNWANACKGEGEATSPFSYAAPLTETMLLGIVALRAPGQKLMYDGSKMQFTNNPEMDQYLKREYRGNWGM